MIYSVQQIKFEIFAHIKEFGGDFADWYVGIAADPATVLHQRHGVHRDDDIWLFKQGLSFHACRTVQRYFLERLGADGAPPEAVDPHLDCVYVYKKSPRTNP